MPVYKRLLNPDELIERAVPDVLPRQLLGDGVGGLLDNVVSRILVPSTTVRGAFPTLTLDSDSDDDDSTTIRGRPTSTTLNQVQPRPTAAPPSLPPGVVPAPPVTLTLPPVTAPPNGAVNGANNVANGGQSTQTGGGGGGGLSPIAIGTIVAASIIFGLILLALVARKIFQARRAAKRTTWAAGNIAPFEPGRTEKQPEYVAAAAANVSTAAYQRQQDASRAPSGAQYPSYPAQPPPATQFSPAAPSSAGYNAAPYGGPVASNDEIAVVKMTFTPTLPDELPIVKGETIRILVRHDDGWATCEKISNGQRGAVPLDCLEDSRRPGPTAMRY